MTTQINTNMYGAAAVSGADILSQGAGMSRSLDFSFQSLLLTRVSVNVKQASYNSADASQASKTGNDLYAAKTEIAKADTGNVLDKTDTVYGKQDVQTVRSFKSQEKTENEALPAVNSDSSGNNEVTTVSVMSKVHALITSVKNEFVKATGLSPEELDELMELLKMSDVDLFIQIRITEIVVKSNAACGDVSALLSDGDLLGQMMRLSDTVQDLLTQSMLTADDIARITASDEYRAWLGALTGELGEQAGEITAEGAGKPVLQNADLVEQAIAQTADGKQTVSSDGKPEDSIQYERVDRFHEAHPESRRAAVSDGGQHESQQSVQDTAFDVHVFKFSQDTAGSSNDSQTALPQPKAQADQPLDQAQLNNTFINLVQNAADQSETQLTQNLSKITSMRDIADQIIEQIKIMIRPTSTSLEMQLNPANLGKINLSVVSKSGIMTAQFTASTESAREAIESQLHVLRQNLQQQGVKIDAIEVTVTQYEFRQNPDSDNAGRGEDKKQQGRNRAIADDGLDDENVAAEEAQLLAAQMLGVSGGSLDLTA